MAVSSKCLLLFISLLLGYGVLQLEATADNQPYRTSYHFQPPKNWMNGMIWPMLYKGIYHLFFQYNPKGAVWGNIVWGHSTSTDLVNWIPHETAIYPSQPSDINGCWSGSTTILPEGRPVILYTGIDPNNHQVQNLAMPKNLSDPFLREWVKSHDNPLMAPNSYNKINSSSFRDPTTGWLGRDGYWRAMPRSIWLDNSGKQLVQWPIKEIKTLRLKEVNLPKQVLKGGSVLEVSGVTAAQADVIITFEISELSKAQVLDPSWTDPQLLCSRNGASVKGGIGPFGLLVLASKGL
nr:beta-fructofuranosidase, insoluble isoenzyme cwinv1 [Quercus suber]